MPKEDFYLTIKNLLTSKYLKTLKALPKKIILIAISTSSLLILILFLLLVKTARPPAENYFLGSQNKENEVTVSNTKIQEIFQVQIPQLDGKWSIVVKDLKNQNSYSFNERDMFTSASIYKLAVMWATFQAIDDGTLTKDQVLTQGQISLDKTLGFDPNQDEQDSRELVAYSVENALTEMITVSDNYSAILLAEKLGWNNIEDLMKKEGISEIDLTSLNSPFISTNSTSQLLERIYSNTAINAQASQEMKTLLFNQKINNRIPKYLPPGTEVAHKTGELEGVRNDAGIVIGKNSHYIFVFFSNTSSPENAAEQIALLSKEIYDALEQDSP